MNNVYVLENDADSCLALPNACMLEFGGVLFLLYSILYICKVAHLFGTKRHLAKKKIAQKGTFESKNK
jgi:hypothetical protein